MTRLAGIALLGLVFTHAPTSWAAEGDTPPTISLDITNGNVHEALALIARQGGLNISVDARVTGVVTAALRDVTPVEALGVIASGVGARVRQDGDIYIVEPKPLPHERPRALPAAPTPAVVPPTGAAPLAAAPATRAGDIPVGDEQVIRVLHLQYADPALIAAVFGGTVVGGNAAMLGAGPFHQRGGYSQGYSRSGRSGDYGGYGSGYGYGGYGSRGGYDRGYGGASRLGTSGYGGY